MDASYTLLHSDYKPFYEPPLTYSVVNLCQRPTLKCRIYVEVSNFRRAGLFYYKDLLIRGLRVVLTLLCDNIIRQKSIIRSCRGRENCSFSPRVSFKLLSWFVYDTNTTDIYSIYVCMPWYISVTNTVKK